MESTPGYRSDNAEHVKEKKMEQEDDTASFDKYVITPEQFKEIRDALLGEYASRMLNNIVNNSLKKEEKKNRKKNSRVEQQEIMRKGGKMSGYIKYFDNGGRVAGSARSYQSGGKSSAQDLLQQLYQLTQLAVSGSGQQQQQAAQALGQFVGEAMNGNKQYEQIIQAVFDGANQGNEQMTQMAQVLQAIMQQMQRKMEFGGKLDYITMLRNGGRPGPDGTVY